MKVGCEYNVKIKDDLDEFIDKSLVDYIQITIPNMTSYNEAKALARKFPVVIHSNLLNTFGENNFEEIKEFALKIRSLKPLQVIEHFTLLRDEDGAKYGVYFSSKLLGESYVKKICDNINQWQLLLGSKIALENIPVTEDVLAYFKLLKQVQEKTDSEITIDVPHLLLSFYSLDSEKERRDLMKIVKSLPVSHLHIAGLKEKKGELYDCHDLTISANVHSFANINFPNVGMRTIEQSPNTRFEVLKDGLEKVRNLDFFLHHCTKELAIPDHNKVNHEIARSANIIKEGKDTSYRSDFFDGLPCRYNIWTKYEPFLYSLSILENTKKQLSAEKNLEYLVRLIKPFLKFNSWASNRLESSYAIISYFEAGSELLSLQVDSEDQISSPSNESISYETYRLNIDSNCWLEFKTPQNNQKEVYYDKRKVC